MSTKRIKRPRGWGLAGLCMVLFLSSALNIAFCSTQKDAAIEADVANWLAELNTSAAAPRGVSKPAYHKKNGIIKPKEKVHAQDNGPQKISIDFYKVDLHNVFRLLGRISKKNIVVDEGVHGTLTLALQDVPWTFVLQVIKNLKGLASHEVNNTIMIYPANKKMTWESDTMGDASLDFSVVPTDSSSSGLSISPGSSFSISRGLDIKQVKTSQTPPEKIDQAAKLIKKALAAEHRNDLDSAENLFKKAADTWKDNIDLQKKAANIALKNNDELSAYNYGRKALELAPEDSEAATITAVALARMNKPGDAKTYFERAMAGKEVSYDTLWNYAVFLFSHNDFRNALRLITRIEASYSLTPQLLMMKARTYENLGRNDKAIREYRALLTAGKDVPADLQQMARIRLKALCLARQENHSGMNTN